MQIGNWLWNHISHIWEKAPAVVTPKYMIATGQVYLGPCKLYWISCDPSAGSSEWIITDAAAGGATKVLGHFHTGKEGHLDCICPPCPFTTGIWLEKFDKMTSLTFGYV